MLRSRSDRRFEVGVLVLVVVANLAQNLVFAEPVQLITGPAFAAVAVWLALKAGYSTSSLGLGSETVRSGLRVGAAAVVVVLAVLLVIAAVPELRAHFVDTKLGARPLPDVLYETFVRIPIATAGPEEVIFRGALLAIAARRLGAMTGVVVVAALFGLWHVLPTLGNGNLVAGDAGAAHVGATVLGVVVATFGAGLIFGYLRTRSGSVVASFLAHWATNGGALLLAYLVSR